MNLTNSWNMSRMCRMAGEVQEGETKEIMVIVGDDWHLIVVEVMCNIVWWNITTIANAIIILIIARLWIIDCYETRYFFLFLLIYRTGCSKNLCIWFYVGLLQGNYDRWGLCSKFLQYKVIVKVCWHDTIHAM